MQREEDLDFAGDRDATLKLISWFDIDRVRAAKILVVGAGAIGNEVLKNLALLGVGNIYIFDKDTIEMSNLSRSVLYRASDRGKSKALTAAKAVKTLNPAVNVYWHDGDIASDLGDGLVRRMDVVIGCLDNIEARYLVNRLCFKVGTPWIDAGIGSLNGQVRVFVPPEGPCYECSFSDAHYEQLSLRLSCNTIAAEHVKQGRIPTTPTIASLVAAVQVQECLKLLDPEQWKGRTFAGRQFEFNGAHAQVDVMGLPSRDDCPAHDLAIEPEFLVELDGIRASNSIGDLLNEAMKLLGTNAHLYFDHEIALERTCANCGSVVPVFRPLHRIVAAELKCECGTVPQYESDISQTHVVGGRNVMAQLLQTRIGDLGIPKFGIVEAHGPDLAVRYLELAGDSDACVALHEGPVAWDRDAASLEPAISI